MQDRLRDQISAYLAENRVATLGMAGTPGGSIALVSYRSSGLVLECWLPRWSEALYHLEQNPHVNLVIVLGDQSGGLRWLHYRGRAEPAPEPGMDLLYRRLRVVPHRIDLIDEQQGPGIRATLEGLASPGPRCRLR